MNTQKDDSQQNIDLQKKIEEAQKSAEKKENAEHEKTVKEDTGTLELEKTKTELAQMTEQAKHLMADLTNLRKRQEEEKFTWIRTANSELIKALLPIVDNFERARKHFPEEIPEWFKGIEMSLSQFENILKDFGLSPIVSFGQPFNPDLHEAVTNSPGEKNIIIEEFEKGYTLNDRVLRHAKVNVGNGEKA